MTHKEYYSPMLSIILPVYNRENYIERAIGSILNQTFSDWELIIVDDGSTDSSGEICDGYAQNDNRIRVFHTNNHGVSHARNVGLDNAQGEWFAFLDSDDEYLPDAFKTMFEYSDDVDIVVATSVYIPSYKVNSISRLEPLFFAPQSDESEELLVNYLYHVVWAKLFRRDTIKHRFNESLQKNEDVVFSIESLKTARCISYVPKVVILYYEGSELSLNSGFFISHLKCLKAIYDAVTLSFTRESIQRRAGSGFISDCINFFANIVFRDTLGCASKKMLIKAIFEENITTMSKQLLHGCLTPERELIWNSILSGDSERIINDYEENRHLFIFEDMMNNETIRESVHDFCSTFSLCLADLKIEIAYKYDFTREKCSGYICQNNSVADIVVCLSDESIASIAKRCLDNDDETVDKEYSEFAALPFLFYGELPKFDAFWLHSATIEMDGVAYVFSSKRGVGDSINAVQWLKAFPGARIISSDNTIIRLNHNDGKFYAYGTPFCCVNECNENRGVPLKAVFFLQFGSENEIHRVKPEFALVWMMNNNCCINAANGEAHYNLYKDFIEKTELYSLSCNMDTDVAKLAYIVLNK